MSACEPARRLTPQEIHAALRARFGDAIGALHAEARDKDPWLTCDARAIEGVALHMRDDASLAFDWLECMTGTDYPAKEEGSIHVTLHLYSYARKHRAVIKVLLARDAPSMPTLSNVWPCAIWQERECFDLLGVRFEGHPDLRRILLPEDWVGHPSAKGLRRGGRLPRHPDDAPEPDRSAQGAEEVREARRGKGVSELVFDVRDADGAPRDEMVLNLGPHHPSTHGVLRFVVHTDGEILRKAVPDVGYLHRSIEKIAERCTYQGFMPYTDRVDYLAAMFANESWAMACERLMGIEVPPRAKWLRAISCELNRIASHMIALGAMAMDIGAVTPFPYCLRERESINDLVEELCGARLTYNYHRIGGVSFDLPRGWDDKVNRWLDHFEPTLDELDRLITRNEIFVKRLASVAVITKDEAIAFGLVGPNLRATGFAWDVRKEDGYGAYPEVEFDVPVGRGEVGALGDCWDRFDVRVRECKESARILRQCLAKIGAWPENEIVGALPKKMRPDGEAYARVESARGDMGCYVIGAGKDEAYRARFRTGSFNAMGIVEKKSEGLFLADLDRARRVARRRRARDRSIDTRGTQRRRKRREFARFGRAAL